MAPLYPDLPADPRRLSVLEAHITGQLRRVWENLYEVETGDQPWASGPALGWRLQQLPTAVNQAPRQVLHREDCWIDSGDALTAAEAVDYAGRPHVELCRLCRPRPLPGPLPSRKSAASAEGSRPASLLGHCRDPGRSSTTRYSRHCREPSRPTAAARSIGKPSPARMSAGVRSAS
ncbi:DUF6233 domain-containing protein [Actinacidiphila glaucinigra]|uniref:DUF6233 domain-containing protein n=1 Tax=Actinacidiphila glaucinigra TaxID=235986 RepID=UPI00370D78F3